MNNCELDINICYRNSTLSNNYLKYINNLLQLMSHNLKLNNQEPTKHHCALKILDPRAAHVQDTTG
jgi:hypothetical protein